MVEALQKHSFESSVFIATEKQTVIQSHPRDNASDYYLEQKKEQSIPIGQMVLCAATFGLFCAVGCTPSFEDVSDPNQHTGGSEEPNRNSGNNRTENDPQNGDTDIGGSQPHDAGSREPSPYDAGPANDAGSVNDAGPTNTTNNGSNVFADAGTIMDGGSDPVPVRTIKRISPDDGEISENPSLAWNGLNYGIAWEDSRHGLSEIYFKLIDDAVTGDNGNVRITFSNDVESLNGGNFDPSLIAVGQTFGLTWIDSRHASPEVYFGKISEAGALLYDDRVTDRMSLKLDTSIVYSELESRQEYIITWSDGWEIYLGRVDARTRNIIVDGRVSSNFTHHARHPSLALTPDGYGLIWNDFSTISVIYFAQLIGNTTRVGDVDTPINYPTNDNDTEGASLVWNGTNFGLCWSNSGLLYFGQIETDGSVGDHEAVQLTPMSHLTYAPSMVWTGSEYGISWTGYRPDSNDDPEIYFMRIHPDGEKIGEETQITSADDAESSTYPSLVWNNDDKEYAVSWSNSSSSLIHEIYFTRITGDFSR